MFRYDRRCVPLSSVTIDDIFIIFLFSPLLSKSSSSPFHGQIHRSFGDDPIRDRGDTRPPIFRAIYRRKRIGATEKESGGRRDLSFGFDFDVPHNRRYGECFDLVLLYRSTTGDSCVEMIKNHFNWSLVLQFGGVWIH